jgi:16S rRNA (guanine1207-N2)-methyltransferase
VPDHYFAASPDADDRRRELDVMIAGRRLTVATSSGVFSGDGLDHATARLLETLADDDSSPARVLDLGCGWGPVSLALGLQHPDAELWAVDVNERALELTRANAARHGVTVTAAEPGAVPDDLRFDAIWSNPPIRIGKDALHALLVHWLDRLTDDGALTMVVGKNLGADSLQRWLNDQGWPTERLASAKGFRVLRTRRA